MISDSERHPLLDIAIALQARQNCYASGFPLASFEEFVSAQKEASIPLLIVTDSGTVEGWSKGSDGALLQGAIEKGLKRSYDEVKVIRTVELEERKKEIQEAGVILILGEIAFEVFSKTAALSGTSYSEAFGRVIETEVGNIITSLSPLDAAHDPRGKRNFWLHLQQIMKFLRWEHGG